MDWPELLLTLAVRWMPAQCGDWGAAMLAELRQLQQPRRRWQFAWGCARVALFPPRRGGFFMNDRMNHWFTTLGAAVLFGLLLMAPFAFMEYWNNPGIRSGEFSFPVALFFGLWLAPTLFFLTATPIVRRLRAGEPILAHPIALLLRAVLLAFLAIGWGNLLRDQMPCFLGGVPGCD